MSIAVEPSLFRWGLGARVEAVGVRRLVKFFVYGWASRGSDERCGFACCLSAGLIEFFLIAFFFITFVLLD